MLRHFIDGDTKPGVETDFGVVRHLSSPSQMHWHYFPEAWKLLLLNQLFTYERVHEVTSRSNLNFPCSKYNDSHRTIPAKWYFAREQVPGSQLNFPNLRFLLRKCRFTSNNSPIKDTLETETTLVLTQMWSVSLKFRVLGLFNMIIFSSNT